MNVNTIEFNGTVYSTLADVLVNGSDIECQQNSILIPSGWELAPYSPETLTLVATYTWSTEIVYLADYTSGSLTTIGIGTLNSPSSYNVGGAYCSNNQCGVSCYIQAQILIRQIPYGNFYLFL